MKPTRKSRRNGHSSEAKIHRQLDDFQEFEAFKEQILPIIRKALINGISADEIYQRFQALAAARMVSIALTDSDPAKAAGALKDILDRAGGKAKERTEVTHKYKNLSDQELDALLHSQAGDVLSKDNEDEEDGNGDQPPPLAS